MPKFTQEELEEIRRNTEHIEQARKDKQTKKEKAKSTKKKVSRKKKEKEYGLKERLFPLILLLVTLGISYLVVLFF